MALLKRLGIAAGAGAAVLGASTVYARRYKLDDQSRSYPLLGDDFFDPATEPVFDGGGVAIDIDAPADVVWAHIKQMGQDRAGWYSFEKLERLFTFDIHNHYTIHPEWQQPEVGDFLFYHQPPLGIGSEIIAIDDEKRQMATVSDTRRHPFTPGAMHLLPPFLVDYFAWTWNFGVQEIGPNKCRYITRAQVSFAPFTTGRKLALATVFGFPSYFMLSRQCDVLKAVCEGRMPVDKAHV